MGSFNLLDTQIFIDFLLWIKRLWFLWLPFFLGYFFWTTWLGRIRARFLKSNQRVLLEIKLPREIYKSPRAMEVVLNVFYSTRDGNMLEKYWQGYLRSWSSLEIVGINGEVRFFIYVGRIMRNLIEAQFYAQYPGVEIVEVDDYSRVTDFNNLDEWKAWGAEFGLVKEDAYPIRTYVDYGLHELVTKEEQKTDPLTAFLEYLGSLKKGEQVWMQILIRATKKNWTDEGNKVIEKITGVKEGEAAEDRMKAVGGLTAGQVEAIKAVDRNMSKIGFDTGIRIMYVARRDVFNKVNKAAIYGVMRPYSSVNLNSFKPVKTCSVDYFFVEKREARLAKSMIFNYQKRAYFYPPYVGKHFILNTEELATVFHFPGRVAETPTFARIEAKKGEPPPNLPV